jgi:hypothetical protein
MLQPLFINGSIIIGMRFLVEYQNPVPDPSKLGFGPILDGLPLVLAGAAAIFALILIMYFLLRGKKEY